MLLRAGYRVVAGDVSRIALEQTRRRYGKHPRVSLIQADFDDWPFAEQSFGAVVMVDFFERRLFDAIRESVAVDGYVLIDTFLRDPRPGRAPSCNPDYLLEPGELDRAFADWRVLQRRTCDRPARRDAILARRTTP